MEVRYSYPPPPTGAQDQVRYSDPYPPMPPPAGLLVLTTHSPRPPGEHWRQSALYNPASDDGRASPSPDYDYDDGYGEAGYGGASPPRTYSPSYSAPYHHSESREMSWPSPRAGGSGRCPELRSWAAEADKILAEAQAKIDEALQRERLLQDTLDMLLLHCCYRAVVAVVDNSVLIE